LQNDGSNTLPLIRNIILDSRPDPKPTDIDHNFYSQKYQKAILAIIALFSSDPKMAKCVQHFSICANSKLEYFKYTPAYYNSLNTIYIDYACGLDFFDWSCDINVEKKLIRIRDLKSTILLLDNLEIEEEEGS